MSNLHVIPDSFGIYKLTDTGAALEWQSRWAHERHLVWFLSRTPHEVSLICPTRCAPARREEAKESWRGVYFDGQLDFSLVGVLSRLTTVLADAGLGVLALSTYETDYTLFPESELENALAAMRAAGYELVLPAEDQQQ